MSSGWDKVKAAVESFISRPSPEPPYVGAVEARSGDGLAVGEAFVPEMSYFSVRLVDMRLAEGGKYFINYLPLGVCVAEYTYGAERRRVPLVLSSEKVKQMLGDAGGEPGHVQFTNIPVVQRTPVKHDNLALFVGLFRMPYSDIAHSVLQLAADVSEELGGAAFGATAGIAAKVYDRVTGIFSLNGVEPRFAFLDGMALSKSGYILISGPLHAGLEARHFVVEEKRLKLRADNTSRLPDGFDYCVLAMEHTGSLFPADGSASATLAALAGLPFHQQWRSVSNLLAKRKAAEAEEAFSALWSEVNVSPDLTEKDRLLAIAGYNANYALYETALSAKPGAEVPAKRGYRSGTFVTGLKAVALDRKAQGEHAVADALNGIALQLQSNARRIEFIPGQEIPEIAMAEVFSGLRDTMAAAWKQGVRATTLANALAAAAIRET